MCSLSDFCKEELEEKEDRKKEKEKHLVLGQNSLTFRVNSAPNVSFGGLRRSFCQ